MILIKNKENLVMLGIRFFCFLFVLMFSSINQARQEGNVDEENVEQVKIGNFALKA